MAETERLPIRGYGDAFVPNQFLKQTGDTGGLAILLPGLGYTCDMPIFYYTELQFLVGGFDVLRVDYDYRQLGFQSWSDAEQEHHLIEDVMASVQAGVAQRSYDEVTVVGKSLGHFGDGASCAERRHAVVMEKCLADTLVATGCRMGVDAAKAVSNCRRHWKRGSSL